MFRLQRRDVLGPFFVTWSQPRQCFLSNNLSERAGTIKPSVTTVQHDTEHCRGPQAWETGRALPWNFQGWPPRHNDVFNLFPPKIWLWMPALAMVWPPPSLFLFPLLPPADLLTRRYSKDGQAIALAYHRRTSITSTSHLDARFLLSKMS